MEVDIDLVGCQDVLTMTQKPEKPEMIAARVQLVATWVDKPNSKKHPYNDAQREVDQWGTIARPPSVQALMDAGLVLEYLEKVIPTLVENARADGETWQDIGESLGISRQAAQQRFGGKR